MTHDNVTDIERRYLLQKRGLYYRPDRCGYTGIKEHAGRYFEHEASLPDVVAIHEDEAAEFSPSCYDDLARQHLQEQNASLRKQLENARSGTLEEAAVLAEAHSNLMDAPNHMDSAKKIGRKLRALKATQ